MKEPPSWWIRFVDTWLGRGIADAKYISPAIDYSKERGWLPRQGTSLYRGFSIQYQSRTPAGVVEDFIEGKLQFTLQRKMDYRGMQRPIESWTTDPRVARTFIVPTRTSFGVLVSKRLSSKDKVVLDLTNDEAVGALAVHGVHVPEEDEVVLCAPKRATFTVGDMESMRWLADAESLRDMEYRLDIGYSLEKDSELRGGAGGTRRGRKLEVGTPLTLFVDRDKKTILLSRDGVVNDSKYKRKPSL